MLSEKEWYSGFAQIDILSSSDVIQQTIARSVYKENCKHLKNNITFKATSV